MAQHVSYTANDHVCALGTIFQGWGPEFEGCLLEDIPQPTISKRHILSSVQLRVTVWIVALHIKGKGAESKRGGTCRARDAGSEGAVGGGAGGASEVSVLPFSQVCCKHKLALKSKVLKK